MSLPILESPKYEAKVPSTGKKVNYRPYLVKEEKILMIAMESDNQAQILDAMKEVVKACTYNKVDVEKLTIFDLEFLFLKLRSKSVGEIAKVGIHCEKCQVTNKQEINLDLIEVNVPVVNNKIKLTEKVGVVLHWPHVGSVNMDEVSKKNKIDIAMDLIANCIESIYDEKAVYPAADSTLEELLAFLGSLSQAQFTKIQEFVNKMPRLQHEVEFTCVCGHKNKLTLQGLQSFFE